MQDENQNQYLIRLIAISIISVLFLYVWNTFISPPHIPPVPRDPQARENYQNQNDPQRGTNVSQNSFADSSNLKKEILESSFNEEKEEFYTLSNSNVKIVFSSKNAIISESYIYFNDGLISPNLEEGNFEGLETGSLLFDDVLTDNINPSSAKSSFYNISEKSSNSITFIYVDPQRNISIQKIYTLMDYQVDLDIAIQKGDDNKIVFSLLNGSYLGATEIDKTENSVFNRIQVGYNKNLKYKKVFGFNLLGFLKSDQEKRLFQGQEKSDWVAIDDRFFGRVLKNKDQNSRAIFRKIDHEDKEHYAHGYRFAVQEKLAVDYSFYFLPKSRALFESYYANQGEYFSNLFHQMKINRVLSNVMYKILQLIFDFLKDYGWAVIVMTILIKLLVFPLTQKSMKSMQKMSDLAPKLEGLRKTHKKNPKQLNIETLALYKKHNVNPIMGCFPILLTIPIFIALYSLFQSMIELKGVSFYWIDDLALPDVIATLGFHIPLMGNQLRLLPILMVVTSFLQSLYTPSPTAGSVVGGGGGDNDKKSQQRQMAMMMKYYMPIMLFFISWNMPSALVLYWTCQNIFSLFQTFLLKISKK